MNRRVVRRQRIPRGHGTRDGIAVDQCGRGDTLVVFAEHAHQTVRARGVSGLWIAASVLHKSRALYSNLIAAVQ